MNDADRTVPASSECPICGVASPHNHTESEIALFEHIDPVAKALCSAFGYDWNRLIDEWPWPTGRTFLCRDFFRWQARFALGVTRPRDRLEEPVRQGLPVHGGSWPLSVFAQLRAQESPQ